MIYLILIGGGLFILLGVISAVFFIGKSSGKQKKEFDILKTEKKEDAKSTKRRIIRNNNDIDDVDTRLRENARDR